MTKEKSNSLFSVNESHDTILEHNSLRNKDQQWTLKISLTKVLNPYKKYFYLHALE